MTICQVSHAIYHICPSSLFLPVFHLCPHPSHPPPSDFPSICVPHKRDKGNIWKSASLSASYPLSINANPLYPRNHCWCMFCLTYLCLLWATAAKAWQHVSNSFTEKYNSFNITVKTLLPASENMDAVNQTVNHMWTPTPTTIHVERIQSDIKFHASHPCPVFALVSGRRQKKPVETINKFHHNKCVSLFCSLPHISVLVERFVFLAHTLHLIVDLCICFQFWSLFSLSSDVAPPSSFLSMAAVVALLSLQPTPYLGMNSFSCH